MSCSSWPIIMMLFLLSFSIVVSLAQIIKMHLPSPALAATKGVWVYISEREEGGVNVEGTWDCLFLFISFLNSDILLMFQIINHSNLFIPPSSGFNLHLRLAKSIC